jgi:hypothetical protein
MKHRRLVLSSASLGAPPLPVLPPPPRIAEDRVLRANDESMMWRVGDDLSCIVF